MTLTTINLETCAQNGREGLALMRGADKQMKQGHEQWIEGALKAADALYAARMQMVDHAVFSKWCDENGFGADAITKDERAALIKIGADLPYWRETLAKTKSRSLRLITAKPAPTQPSASPAKNTAQPHAKKIVRTFETPDSEEWDEVVPSKDMKKLLMEHDNLVDKHNELVKKYNEQAESLRRTVELLKEAVAERTELELDYDSLKDVVTKHGLDWWAGMPALRITDSEKATEWFELALAYYAEWDRLRLTGSDEEFERAHDDFYARWAEEKDSSESEPPVTAPEPIEGQRP
jgi:hypothetical protein